MKKLTIVLLMAACSHKAPPISDGKCVVDRYEEDKAVKQTCVFGGYTWQCTEKDCDRAGEAVGERPK